MSPLQPTLTTPNFRIRPSVPADHDALFTIASKPGIWDQHDHPERATVEGFTRFFQKGLRLGTALTFERLSDGAVVGSSRYLDFGKDCWEIGWTFYDPALWGTGANGEVKQALLAHAFRHVSRVTIHVWQGNRRSQGAVRKLGATVISHQHELGPSRPEFVAFLLTRDDWRRQAGVRQLRRYLAENPKPQLVFVCTHNSRRSHFAAVAALAAARRHGREVKIHSAGTEATACHPHTIAALRRAGHLIDVLPENSEADNRRYALYADRDGRHTNHLLWSKTLNDPSLPSANFAAVMVCADADANCPMVPGADARIALPFDDPKASDGSGLESVIYDAAYAHIFTVMNEVFPG